MARKRSVHHHYVPRVLQKQFCFERTSLFYASKNARGDFRPIERRNTKSVFQERNHFTILDENREPSDVVETEVWGSIDNYLGEILPQIVDIVERGGIPGLVPAQEAKFRSALTFLLRRSPDFVRERYKDDEVGKDFYEGLLKSSGFCELPLEEQSRLITESQDHQNVVAVGRSIRTQSQIQPLGEREVNYLEKYTLRWALARDAAEFVLSSRMIYRIGNGGSNGLQNPESELWFPISPKVAAVFVRDERKQIPAAAPVDWDFAYDINVYALRSSQEVASPSKELLEFYVKQCELQCE